MPLNLVQPTTPASQPFVQSQRSKGQHGYTPIRFLGSLRGEGVLAVSGGRVQVTYQLDQYEGRAGLTGNGSLEGPLGAEAAAGDEARLHLDDGRQVEVTLQETDASGAVFETRGAFSKPGAKLHARRAGAAS